MTNISVYITANNHSKYNWRIAGEGGGLASGRQGCESNLSLALETCGNIISKSSVESEIFVEYRRYLYDRDYPECESSRSCYTTTRVNSMVNKPGEIADYLIHNTKQAGV